jgi:uncharacterized membrane protein
MQTNSQSKPSLVMAIALMTLLNGIFNVIWGISIIVGTIGLSLLCFPVPLFPIILGGFEIAYAIKLLANPPVPVQPSQSIAILEIVALFVGNVFSLVVGILVLIFYNDTAVKDYYARLNGQAVPAEPVQPIQSLPVEPVAPALEEPATPEKPKRAPRKVA